MTFSAHEKHDEAVRELRFRVRVYERMVNVNQLTRETANRRMALMEEIAEDYKRVMQGEDLFGEDAVRSARAKTNRRYRPPADVAGPDRTGTGPPEEPVPPSSPPSD